MLVKTTAYVTKARSTIRIFPSYAKRAFVGPGSLWPREVFHIAKVTVN